MIQLLAQRALLPFDMQSFTYMLTMALFEVFHVFNT